MSKEELKKILWESANKLRGGIASGEYMHITLGLIFLKYISDKFEVRYNKLVEDADGFENERDAYEEDNIFWIPEDARWKNVSKYSKSEDLGVKLDEAFKLIEKENPQLKNILPKTYSKLEVDVRRLGELVDLFTNKLNTTQQSGDFMGEVYEYFLGEFSRNLGQRGGEFFTPECVVELLVNMIEPFNGKVYDPCCGSGGMFVHSAKFVKEHNGNINDISIYGQELNATTWRLAKMNLAIRGIEPDLGASNGDTFHDDRHKTLRADYILANPPFNIKDYGQERLLEDPRWVFGTPPKGNANYAWIQHMYSKLKPNGTAGFILANGSLSTSQKGEYEIRKELIEKGHIDAIIALPDSLFSTTGIPVSLWVMSKNKQETNKHRERTQDVLFIDARSLGEMITRKQRALTEKNIKQIYNTYHSFRNLDGNYSDVKGFCKVASIKEVAEQDYALTPGRYVGIEDEVDDGIPFEEKFANLKKELEITFEKNAELEEEIKKQLEKIV